MTTYRFDPVDLEQMQLLSRISPGGRIRLMLGARELAVGLIRGRLRWQYPDLSSRITHYYLTKGYESPMPRDQHASRSARAAARRLARWTQQAEELPLRRDMVALLTYLRDNRVTGTQSTGNLTLKAVREVTARFVHPPQLDTTIGDRTYRLRTEYDVWPLYFLHTLAEVGGLVAGGPSRRWRLTSEGARFLSASPPVQVWVLLIFWWKYVNWLIAYPFGRMDEDLPLRFEEITLTHLLSLPVDTRIPFEPFADELIQETGLACTVPDVAYARMVLHTAVSRMIVGILADFGALEREYQDEPLGKGTTRDLVAFRVTPFGRDLLETLAAHSVE
jgi:hypothetical protein